MLLTLLPSLFLAAAGGFVVSDCGAVSDIADGHNTATVT
ncbi:hypothetical protein HaLaN_09658 [Haematococcus lacustris]|uniref:Uncharacterized protein n=1 Tax=Haematococcus lacustris TaxID=44745 RepID=A0A699YVY1_HAELA|nr:hypothetical protein HaLaN_09658 [Haematococcus lacustris]